MAELYTDSQQNSTLKKKVVDNFSMSALTPFRAHFDQSGFSHPANWYSYIDLKVMMGEVYLTKLDRMTMLNGIEARSPFLDTQVVDVALGITPELRFGEGDKTLLRTLAQKYLPKEIVTRRKKGFSYPFIEWMSESGELDKIVILNQKYQLFEEVQLDFMIKRAKLKGRFKHHLFSIYIYLRWLDKNR
jgi:asparagine synthase (glutamine-hydrolysing)